LNALQKFLSYLFPVLLERVGGDLEHQLSVYLDKGKLKLYTEETNYSFGQLHRVFQNALKGIVYKEKEDSKILILGFGAGSIASIIRQELNIKSPMIGVELDKVVLDLYKRYFSTTHTNLSIVHTDAFKFVTQSQDKFDLILIDLFVDQELPEFCTSSEFMKGVAAILDVTGTVVFNTIESTLAMDRFEKSLGNSFIIQNKKKIFGQNCVYILKKTTENH